MTTTGTHRAVTAGPAAVRLLLILDALLILASGAIHLHLWDIAYRHVHVLGPLFLLQAISALVIAVALVATRHLLAVGAALALVLGTIAGFILVLTTGLFGFKLGFVSGEAYTVLAVEAVAVITLAITGRLMLARRAGR
jgi:hypothetical protein